MPLPMNYKRCKSLKIYAKKVRKSQFEISNKKKEIILDQTGLCFKNNNNKVAIIFACL